MGEWTSIEAAESSDAGMFDGITDALRTQGWCIRTDGLPPVLAQALLLRALELEADAFQPAGVGRGSRHLRNELVRRDEIHWITAGHAAETAWLNWLGELRLALNRALLLGLFDVETHFAHYPPGAFYRRHVDAFKDATNRVLSVVAYLNPNWLVDDGGELVLYAETGEVLERCLPRFGTLALFLSEVFPHEVLPTRRDRYSVTGWFRVNSFSGGIIVPTSLPAG